MVPPAEIPRSARVVALVTALVVAFAPKRVEATFPVFVGKDG
jgi:hypothetical protein